MEQTKSFMVPSGHTYTIRAQNGEDDGLLSNQVDSLTGANYDKFIQAIVTKTDAFPLGKVTEENVDQIPVLDYSYIILFSRAWSIGEDVRFSYNWGKAGTHIYVENLKPYLPDYTKEIPKPGDKEYFALACPKYPLGKQKVVEFTLSSGKEVKYNILNRAAEKKLLEIPENQLNINTKFMLRGLELKVQSQWYPVSNFKQFTPVDMRELRNNLKNSDPDFGAFSRIQNPQTQDVLLVRLLDQPDFFFPLEI